MFRHTVAALAVAGCLVTPASARVLKYVTYPTERNYSAVGGTSLAVYQHQGNDRIQLAFRVPAKPTVVITYNATCEFKSSYVGNAWLDVDVIIDSNAGQPIPPSDSQRFALCGQSYVDEAPVTSTTSRGSIVIVTDLTPGLHTLMLNARLRGSNGTPPADSVSIRVGFSTLTIETGN